MDVNWAQLGFAGGLGLVIGFVVLASGVWMDKIRDRKFNRDVRALTGAPDVRRTNRAIRMIRGLRRGA
jgi:hypothetical protein